MSRLARDDWYLSGLPGELLEKGLYFGELLLLLLLRARLHGLSYAGLHMRLEHIGVDASQDRLRRHELCRDIDAVKLDDVYEFAKNTDCEEAEALVVLCTGLRTIPTIERLERRLQKPVITAIQASMWNALRMVGIDDKVEGYGSLFER